MSKELKITVIDYLTFSDYLFVPPATFYIQNAMGDYLFIHTSSRSIAQDYIDSIYPKGHYKVVASKLQKTTSKLESGELSCRGTPTRKK